MGTTAGNALMSDLMRRLMPPDPNYPMTPSQVEASRRAIADARFREGAPVAANMAFEATGLPTMARGVANIDQGIQQGSPLQAVGGAGQVALGALPFGSGRVLGGLIPAAESYAARAATMPGVSGVLARNVPGAAGLIGVTEGTKAALSAGTAEAAGLPPIPATDDARELQTFLRSQGYDIAIDGQMGPNTRRALSDYSAKFQAQQAQAAQAAAEAEALKRKAAAERAAAENSPEAIEARLQEQRAEAALKAAHAKQLQGQEAGRRADVLKEAEARYDATPETWGEFATNKAQEWIGPVIMGAAGAAGFGGISKAIGSRRTAGQIDNLAENLAKRKKMTEAEKGAYVKTYDDAGKSTLPQSAAEAAGVYGTLGGEMYLSKMYLDSARKEYDAALSAYEQEAAGGNLDGGREKELADRVVKAKRDVEKWEGLQGAGLHAMGYYTAGKLGGLALGKAKPGAEATNLRNQYKEELRGPMAGKALSPPSVSLATPPAPAPVAPAPAPVAPPRAKAAPTPRKPRKQQYTAQFEQDLMTALDAGNNKKARKMVDSLGAKSKPKGQRLVDDYNARSNFNQTSRSLGLIGK
jgi:hypothetical protein